MNSQKALALIRSLGIKGLCESDGCECRYFNIHGIHVDVSCRKSEHCIRVYSHHMFIDPRELNPIAEEVLKQVGADRGYSVRFCEYSYDHVNGHWEGEYPNSRWVKTQKCCYCDSPRADEEAYLCSKCLEKPEARGAYPWGLLGNQISPEEQRRQIFAPLLENCHITVIGEKELRGMAEMLRKPQ